MAAPKRSKIQIEANRREIAALYLRGWRQSDIAVHLGMTRPMVTYDLKAIYADWRADAVADINEAKTRELARIDELERTYWDEWERSREERQVTQTKRTEAGAVRSEASVRRENSMGDPRYLAGVQWCIERRCAILGIDAPKRQEVSGPDGGAVMINIMGAIGDDGDSDE